MTDEKTHAYSLVFDEEEVIALIAAVSLARPMVRDMAMESAVKKLGNALRCFSEGRND